MTRLAITGGLILALAAFAAADDKKAAPTPLEGNWKVVSASVDGKAEAKEKLPNMVFAFEGAKLTITEGDNKPDVGSFSVDAKAEPAHIDMVSPKGAKVSGIYKIGQDGKLTLVFSKGKDMARPKAFDGKDAVMLVLEKVKK